MLTETPIARANNEPSQSELSPLRHIDAVIVSQAARVETRNREVHLPPVSAYRWWARRTESINGAILDAFALDRPGRRLLVADPFVGGGIIPLAAVMRGYRVYGQDLNPWATAGLVGMLGLSSTEDLAAAARRLEALASPLLDQAYGTTFSDGSPASISHTFRVATAECPECRQRMCLFPHALVSLRVRRERRQPEAILACPAGHLFDGVESGAQACAECGITTDPERNYTPRRVATCPSCSREERLEVLAAGGSWSWVPVLVERAKHGARELAYPTGAEVAQAADGRWSPSMPLAAIPEGQETAVLLRHGFRFWHDIYPARQRVLIESLISFATLASDHRETVQALRLAIIGSAEMAGLLSRWDRYYLKSYESMAGHRFNFTTFAAEPNVWGAKESGRGSASRRVSSLVKAANWLASHEAHNLRVEGPLLASSALADSDDWDVRVVEGSSERILLADGVVDIALTDPPYHDDVQYDELSLPLRAWARQSLEHLDRQAAVNPATGENADGHDYEHLLRSIFIETGRTLRPDGHLVFSYANREPSAWVAVFRALQGAGYHASGYSVLHSENETDWAKRHVRACTMDLLMDLVRAPVDDTWSPANHPATEEGAFLHMVGGTFLRVGVLTDEDLVGFESALGQTAFLGKADEQVGISANLFGDATVIDVGKAWPGRETHRFATGFEGSRDAFASALRQRLGDPAAWIDRDLREIARMTGGRAPAHYPEVNWVLPGGEVALRFWDHDRYGQLTESLHLAATVYATRYDEQQSATATMLVDQVRLRIIGASA